MNVGGVVAERAERSRMSARGVVIADRAEQIKWWNVIDTMAGRLGDADAVKGLRMARECRHPDAQWLVSLFPAGVPVTPERVLAVMLLQKDDPLAMLLAHEVGLVVDEEFKYGALLMRAAEMGYAPAQAQVAMRKQDSFQWAERAAAQGDRHGMYQLAYHLYHGVGCEKDRGRALKLVREGAELGDAAAQAMYGAVAFDELDWVGYHWCSLALAQGFDDFGDCTGAVSLMLPLFERCEYGHILHLFGPILKAGLHIERDRLYYTTLTATALQQVQRVIVLHEDMLDRAKTAIACWSMAGRRLGVVKDMRVMIAKMAWAEPWKWGENEELDESDEHPEKVRRD
jgi:hypothetical protein